MERDRVDLLSELVNCELVVSWGFVNFRNPISEIRN